MNNRGDRAFQKSRSSTRITETKVFQMKVQCNNRGEHILKSKSSTRITEETTFSKAGSVQQRNNILYIHFCAITRFLNWLYFFSVFSFTFLLYLFRKLHCDHLTWTKTSLLLFFLFLFYDCPTKTSLCSYLFVCLYVITWVCTYFESESALDLWLENLVSFLSLSLSLSLLLWWWWWWCPLWLLWWWWWWWPFLWWLLT